MKSINKRKDNFDKFAWKVIDILKKSETPSLLTKEEKSLYNNWMEDIDFLGVVLIPQNKVIELESDSTNIFLYSVGVFNKERLISGIEIILEKENNQELNTKKLNFFYGEDKIKDIFKEAFSEIENDLKGNIKEQNKIINNPLEFSRKLFEENKNYETYLNINRIQEELGENVKKYLNQKQNLN